MPITLRRRAPAIRPRRPMIDIVIDSYFVLAVIGSVAVSIWALAQ
jgi:hypothetical protein